MILLYRTKKWPSSDFPCTTIVLMIANTAAYLFLALCYDPSLSTLFVPKNRALDAWGQNNRAILEQGQFLRLISALFVHAHVLHLLSNLLFLAVFGIRFEELRRPEECALVYFASGLAGNLLSLLWGLDYLSVGASGAIFGLFGADLMLLRREYRHQVRTVFFIAFIFFTITISVDTNVLAHAGGLCTGVLLGYTLDRTFSSNRLSPTRSRSIRKRRLG